MTEKNIVKELGLDLSKKEDLYMLLNAITMSAAKIRAGNALQGAKAVKDHGLITPEAMLNMPYWDKVKILNRNGYARFDESRGRFFEHNAKIVKDKYKGNLHNLLGAAEYKPGKIKELVMEFKGVGPVASDMLIREIKPHIKLKKASTREEYLESYKQAPIEYLRKKFNKEPIVETQTFLGDTSWLKGYGKIQPFEQSTTYRVK